MLEQKKGNKTTIPILALMVGGLILGFIGLIKRDADTISASNFWNVMMIVGAVAFAGGFIWLNVIQPRNK
jgi:uncharacterized membrane protein YdcZ (DUF606 family)